MTWKPIPVAESRTILFSFLKAPWKPSWGPAAPTSAWKRLNLPMKMDGQQRARQMATGNLSGKVPDRYCQGSS